MMAFAYPEIGKLTQDVAAANVGQLRFRQIIYTLNRQSKMLTNNIKFNDYNYRAMGPDTFDTKDI